MIYFAEFEFVSFPDLLLEIKIIFYINSKPWSYVLKKIIHPFNPIPYGIGNPII